MNFFFLLVWVGKLCLVSFCLGVCLGGSFRTVTFCTGEGGESSSLGGRSPRRGMRRAMGRGTCGRAPVDVIEDCKWGASVDEAAGF